MVNPPAHHHHHTLISISSALYTAWEITAGMVVTLSSSSLYYIRGLLHFTTRRTRRRTFWFHWVNSNISLGNEMAVGPFCSSICSNVIRRTIFKAYSSLSRNESVSSNGYLPSWIHFVALAFFRTRLMYMHTQQTE